jgi:hypothetical protein
MNNQEQQVLHGLYFLTRTVGIENLVSAGEIGWLVETPIPKTREWRGDDGKLKSSEKHGKDYLATVVTTSSTAEKPLRYLQESGYISFRKEDFYYRVSVTVKGAEFAEQLDSRLGRADLRYRSLKGGLIAFLVLLVAWIVKDVVIPLAGSQGSASSVSHSEKNKDKVCVEGGTHPSIIKLEVNGTRINLPPPEGFFRYDGKSIKVDQYQEAIVGSYTAPLERLG